VCCVTFMTPVFAIDFRDAPRTPTVLNGSVSQKPTYGSLDSISHCSLFGSKMRCRSFPFPGFPEAPFSEPVFRWLAIPDETL